jgi:hypothetical protein
LELGPSGRGLIEAKEFKKKRKGVLSVSLILFLSSSFPFLYSQFPLPLLLSTRKKEMRKGGRREDKEEQRRASRGKELEE